MTDLEKLPQEKQNEIIMTSMILALKKTLISTPELQQVFKKNYEEEIKELIASVSPKSDQ